LDGEEELSLELDFDALSTLEDDPNFEFFLAVLSLMSSW
jgi:hypothetical protein